MSTENADQIEGWALDRTVYTKGKATLAWGFFESRGSAEQEASRLGVGVVPATLILPAGTQQDDEEEKSRASVAKGKAG